MILVIDNYDSFTFNLVQYLGELGQQLEVLRNDAASPERVRELAPSSIVISPGPGTPDDAGYSCQIIREFGPTTPILGVCLGHQSIGQVFGGKVIRAPHLMHGKTSQITHEDKSVFRGLPNPLTATRYHSLIVEEASLPAELEITARSEGDNLIMGLKHREYPIHGVQFHPESILTPEGRKLLQNFLDEVGVPA